MSPPVDDDYWKRRYQKHWQKTSKRENTVLSLIKEAGFPDAQLVGYGAGLTEYLSGSPKNKGKKKGDPDIRVPSVEVAVEVTGTDKESVGLQDDIWVRPDKIQNARDHPDRDTWIVHSLDREGVLRTVRLTRETIERLLSAPRIHPSIEGTIETYIPVAVSDDIVKPFTELLSHMNMKKKSL